MMMRASIAKFCQVVSKQHTKQKWGFFTALVEAVLACGMAYSLAGLLIAWAMNCFSKFPCWQWPSLAALCWSFTGLSFRFPNRTSPAGSSEECNQCFIGSWWKPREVTWTLALELRVFSSWGWMTSSTNRQCSKGGVFIRASSQLFFLTGWIPLAVPVRCHTRSDSKPANSLHFYWV